jgi:chromosome segregation ATPase
MRVPWWLLVVAFLLGSAGTYWWLSRASEEQFREMRAEAQALERQIAWGDSVRAELDAMLEASQFREDSLKEVKQRVEVRIIRAEAKRDTAVADLTEYLADDPFGTNLLQNLLTAFDEQLAAEAEKTHVTELELAEARAQGQIKDRIIGERDSLVARYQVLYPKALAEAERWHRKANPPFTVRLLRDGWKVAAGVGLGYLLGR